jgi:hypothetical protein
MKKLFKLNSKYHGTGAVTFAWQPSGAFLATAGKNGTSIAYIEVEMHRG